MKRFFLSGIIQWHSMRWMWKHQLMIFKKKKGLGILLFLIYCAPSESKHFEQLTYSILIILKENIFMSAEKKIKILNIAFSSTYISHYTEHAIFFSWCVKYQDYFIFILCITLQFFLYHKIHASQWNSYSTPASQLPYSIHHMLHIHVYTGTMDCPSMPGPVVFIG